MSGRSTDLIEGSADGDGGWFELDGLLHQDGTTTLYHNALNYLTKRLILIHKEFENMSLRCASAGLGSRSRNYDIYISFDFSLLL